MFKMFLIKYAEIAIKGKNRYLFEDALVEQIRHALKQVEGSFEVTKESGRVYVSCLSEYDFDEVVEALKRVFGIVGICPVVHIEDKGFENLADEVVRALAGSIGIVLSIPFTAVISALIFCAEPHKKDRMEQDDFYKYDDILEKRKSL